MYDAETIAALASGQLVLREFLTVFGRTVGGDPEIFRFWTGEDNVTTDVVGATTGINVSGNFIGGGTLLEVPAIVDTIGLEARPVDIGLSQLHSSVQDMLRDVGSHTIRVATVELHRGLFDPATWSLVSEPHPIFLGRVDTAGINTPAVGGEGAAAVSAMPDVIDLTRTNPALKSDETQKLRSGDRFRRYGDTAGDVEVWWGQARDKANGVSGDPAGSGGSR